MRKILLGFAVLAAVAGFTAGSAGADVSTNGTTSDAYGYCIANHIANFNGANKGIGHLRSTQGGAAISAEASNPPAYPCVDTQGLYAPISNTP